MSDRTRNAPEDPIARRLFVDEMKTAWSEGRLEDWPEDEEIPVRLMEVLFEAILCKQLALPRPVWRAMAESPAEA